MTTELLEPSIHTTAETVEDDPSPPGLAQGLVAATTDERFKTFANRPLAVHYDRSCVVCGADAPGERIGEVREHEYTNTTPSSFPVYRCPQCRLVYLWPRPDVSELETIYPSNYYSYHMSVNAPTVGTRKKSFVQGLFYQINTGYFRQRIPPYLHNVPSDRPLRVLDVGCGVGAQLDAIKSILPGCETYGVEINEIATAKAKARGHRTFLGRFEEVELPEHYFDVVVSVHVLEHVARPDLFMEKCLNLLTDDGIVLLETPNTDCYDFRALKRRHWGGFHAPRHWYLFEQHTLELLTDRLGGRMIAARPYTMSNFWCWSCHSILMDYTGSAIAGWLFPPVKIMYGGLRSFALLSFFAVFERFLLTITGKASSIWIVIRRKNNVCNV